MQSNLCRHCGQNEVPGKARYCGACREQKVRDNSIRFRAGITMAPGEESVGRTMANCSLRDVAEKFQVSVQRIQQIERIALLKVRRGILPYLAEHDPVAFERFRDRETPAQKWAARTSVRRQLSQKQIQIIAQLKVLADEYEESGQVNTAAQIRREVEDLRFRLEQVLTNKDT
mgnify:CR=1 FL=1|jgi:hypothetical protein